MMATGPVAVNEEWFRMQNRFVANYVLWMHPPQSYREDAGHPTKPKATVCCTCDESTSSHSRICRIAVRNRSFGRESLSFECIALLAMDMKTSSMEPCRVIAVERWMCARCVRCPFSFYRRDPSRRPNLPVSPSFPSNPRKRVYRNRNEHSIDAMCSPHLWPGVPKESSRSDRRCILALVSMRNMLGTTVLFWEYDSDCIVGCWPFG
mmetsp:Transcript_18924/g.39253  ORF Transcript_18924/g.39253 Transcript_18924/m.39253 type:complete len:207 (+) Transcript_18924:668-1288(+)